LDQGEGSPAAMAVLYIAVSELLDFPLHAQPLDGGSYFVLWPQQESMGLCAAGEKFMIDPYAEGSLISEQEVSDIFDVEIPCTPAPMKDIVAAILLQLRDAHWCSALECPTEPAFAIPLCLEVALGEYEDVTVSYTSDSNEGEEHVTEIWWPKNSGSIQRALYAAKKVALVKQDSMESQIDLAILEFFCQRVRNGKNQVGKDSHHAVRAGAR